MDKELNCKVIEVEDNVRDEDNSYTESYKEILKQHARERDSKRKRRRTI